MRSGPASKLRLLEAASEEFARVGIAGARVDRIAEVASVNKAQMYGWFGSKDGLFDAVFLRSLDRIINVVPFTPDDLAGYVASLYDAHVAEPQLLRLAAWYRLERVPTGDLLQGLPGRWDDKLEAIAIAQAEGRIVDDIPPGDVYAMIIAVAGTWSPISPTFAASGAEPRSTHLRRRAMLGGLIERALVPTPA